MSTYDFTSGVYSKPADGLNKVYVMKNVIDFSVHPMEDTETADIFNIPANTLVMEVFYRVITADADSTDFDIGVAGGLEFVDGTGAGGAGSTGWVRDASLTYSPPTGFLSTSDTPITLLQSDTSHLLTAVIEFFALCVDLN
jgi:hypothetical protein